MKVYLEAGVKKVFAGAIDWPGWARSGKTEAAALQALLEYASRYARSTGKATTLLRVPADVRGLNVVARLRGGSGTDFGVPSVVADFDREPVSAAQLAALIERLRAAWKAFDAAADRASGKTLATGPRGGERWPARYAVRRSAWHALDHAWEIEDRS